MAGDASAQILGVYCERGFDPSFWAEPFNAISNAAFVIAGIVALARGRGDPAVLLLALVTIAIGIGSFLFHTLATPWAMVADVAPIQAFIAFYFFFAMRRFFGLGPIAAAFATLGFMAAAAAVPALLPRAEPWRGLGGYLGGLYGLVGVGLSLVFQRHERRSAGLAMLGVAALFSVSLAFRSFDGAVCARFPTGLHLVWHILNALVLLSLMTILGRSPPRIRPNPPVS